MLIRRSCFAVLLCGFVYCLAFAEPRPEVVHLNIGDVKVIPAPEDAELEVSKRGVLQIEEESPGNWRLTALTRGFVVLSFKDADLIKRVHVFSGADVGKASKPPDFCREGIRCAGEMIIDGETASFDLWLSAIGHCRVKRGCLFDVNLTGEGRDVLLDKAAKAIGRSVTIDYRPPDRLIVRQPCLDAEAEKTRGKGSMVKGHWLGLMTLDEACEVNELEVYNATASIMLLSRDATEDLGLDILHQPMDALGRNMVLEPKLIDQLTASKMAIIAQPTVRLRVGQTAKIASGGEFKVMFADERPEHSVREGWKRYGVELQFTLRQAAKDLLQVATELSLSSPQGSGQESLQSHKIASDLLLKLGEKQLVGLTDLYSQVEGERQRSLLSKLPILGPLFTVRSKSDGQRVLMYWLKVDALSPFSLK